MQKAKLLLLVIPFLFACSKKGQLPPGWSQEVLDETKAACTESLTGRLKDDAVAPTICSCWVDMTSQYYEPFQIESEEEDVQNQTNSFFEYCAKQSGETVKMIRSFIRHANREPSADTKVPKVFRKTLERFEEKNPVKPAHVAPVAPADPAVSPVAPADARPVAPVRVVEFDVTDNFAEFSMTGMKRIKGTAGARDRFEKNGDNRASKFEGGELECLLARDPRDEESNKLVLHIRGVNEDKEFSIRIYPFNPKSDLFSAKGSTYLGADLEFHSGFVFDDEGSKVSLMNNSDINGEFDALSELKDVKFEKGILSATFTMKQVQGFGNDRSEIRHGDIQGKIRCTVEDVSQSPKGSKPVLKDRNVDARKAKRDAEQKMKRAQEAEKK